MTGDGSPTSGNPGSGSGGCQCQIAGAVRVEVDRALCDNHGQCVYAAPAVFAFDDGQLRYTRTPTRSTCRRCKAAAAACTAPRHHRHDSRASAKGRPVTGRIVIVGACWPGCALPRRCAATGTPGRSS